jgi:hypothetical protein
VQQDRFEARIFVAVDVNPLVDLSLPRFAAQRFSVDARTLGILSETRGALPSFVAHLDMLLNPPAQAVGRSCAHSPCIAVIGSLENSASSGES